MKAQCGARRSANRVGCKKILRLPELGPFPLELIKTPPNGQNSMFFRVLRHLRQSCPRRGRTEIPIDSKKVHFFEKTLLTLRRLAAYIPLTTRAGRRWRQHFALSCFSKRYSPKGDLAGWKPGRNSARRTADNVFSCERACWFFDK